MKDRAITINTKEEYDNVQNELLSKGYKWIDETETYYDLFEAANNLFRRIAFVIHSEDRTFEWRDVDGVYGTGV